MQNVTDRLDKAFENFFRRCKSGEKPGFPRFRGAHRYHSLCYPQSGFSLTGKELTLSKLGVFKVKMHKSLEGEMKTCTLSQDASGNWHVCFSCEVEVKPLPRQQKAIGIDMGLEHFATLSNGQTIANPRFFKKGEQRLAQAQRKLAKRLKRSSERQKQGKIVAKIHDKIRNQRKDFCYKESRKIVQHYQFIYLEDLSIKKMIETAPFAKNITDASWNQFQQLLTYKAAEAIRCLELVNPAYTTQDSHHCGSRQAKSLSKREHHCLKCEYRTSRDYNAAQNILALGLDGLGKIPRSHRL